MYHCITCKVNQTVLLRSHVADGMRRLVKQLSPNLSFKVQTYVLNKIVTKPNKKTKKDDDDDDDDDEDNRTSGNNNVDDDDDDDDDGSQKLTPKQQEKAANLFDVRCEVAVSIVL